MNPPSDPAPAPQPAAPPPPMSMPERKPQAQLSAVKTVLLLGLALLAMLCILPTILSHNLRALAKDLANVLQMTPHVTDRSTIVLERDTPILELAAMQTDGLHEKRWNHSFLGSEKWVEVKAAFRAKSGFRLQNRICVTVANAGGHRTVTLTLPPPEILSLEFSDLQITSENGWWNKVTDQERADVLNEFRREARRALGTREKLQDKAANCLTQILTAMVRHHLGDDTELRLEFDGAVRPAAAPKD